MNTKEKSKIKNVIDGLPESMTIVDFAEDILLSHRAEEAYNNRSGEGLTTEEFLKEIDKWS